MMTFDRDAYTTALLGLNLAVLTGDAQAAVERAEDISGMALPAEDLITLRATLFNTYSDPQANLGNVETIFLTLGLTKIEPMLRLLEFNHLRDNGMTAAGFENSAAFGLIQSEVSIEFFNALEQSDFFNTLALAAISLRRPRLIKAVLDKMKAVS